MKVLWISNAPWAPSGYGSQTRQVGLRIAKAGYEIEFSANDGTRGDQDWNGLLVRGSSGTERYSRDSVLEDVERSGADWVIALYDAWVYSELGVDVFAGIPRVTAWAPVDHYPTPLSLYSWLEAHGAIAMSEFGYRSLRATSEAFTKNGRKAFPVGYAPHAVESVYTPRDPGRFRELIDVPKDAYLVGIVAANFGTRIYDRKDFSGMSLAMREFMRRHPDAYLYVHTLQKTHEGLDLPLLFQVRGIPVERLRWADQYAIKKQLVSDEQMAEIYSSFDVLLATSRGEGFGLPVIEAQACGTPVIASNWTAQAELVGNGFDRHDLGFQRHPSGWLVRVIRDWDPRQGGDFAVPDTDTTLQALEEAYERRGDETLRDAALAKAAVYDADRVFDTYWRPLLAEMEQALTPPNREQRRAQRAALRKKAA